jgi:hypothetical protein
LNFRLLITNWDKQIRRKTGRGRTWLKYTFRIKRNQRRAIYAGLGIIIGLLFIGLLSAMANNGTKGRILYERQAKLQTLNRQLKTVQEQKADTQSQLQQKATDEASLKAQIDELNKQLQAKAEAKRQSLAAQVINTVTGTQTAQATPVTGGCVSGYFTGQYALDQIISHESGGNSCATNSGGCFGLLQACPGYPLRDACGGNPSCQIAWFQSNKTGGRSWEQIWALWQTQGYW